MLLRRTQRPAHARSTTQDERGRLIDAYVDAHKYVFGKRAVVYGEQDLVVGIASLLAEIGVTPALCASGTGTGRLREQLAAVEADLAGDIAGAGGRRLRRDRGACRRACGPTW